MNQDLLTTLVYSFLKPDFSRFHQVLDWSNGHELAGSNPVQKHRYFRTVPPLLDLRQFFFNAEASIEEVEC